MDTSQWVHNNYTYRYTEIDPSLTYPDYPIEDFKNLVQIDDFNDTVDVTRTPYGVDPSDYEFGIFGGTTPEKWGLTER